MPEDHPVAEGRIASAGPEQPGIGQAAQDETEGARHPGGVEDDGLVEEETEEAAAPHDEVLVLLERGGPRVLEGGLDGDGPRLAQAWSFPARHCIMRCFRDMHDRRPSSRAVCVLLLLMMPSCGSNPGGPTPSPSPSPTAQPGGTVAGSYTLQI